MTDLATRIVTALFDMGSESGGLIKDRAIARVREVLAADVPAPFMPSQPEHFVTHGNYGTVAPGGLNYIATCVDELNRQQQTTRSAREMAAMRDLIGALTSRQEERADVNRLISADTFHVKHP